jgi:hypothetical protein
MKIPLIIVLSMSISAFASKTDKLKDDSKKGMAFDSQTVEGEVYEANYSVVTGELPGEGWGVLRLRSDFKDHARTDSEEAKK